MKMKCFLFILISFISIALQAQDDEGVMSRLFAPGPLMQAHKNLEGPKQCLECHDAGKGVPEAKCLACHKEIKTFVDKKVGYHGLLKEACIKCHTDHKGRALDTTLVDPKLFDHAKTGFALEGKHFDIKCLECHKATRGLKRIRPTDVTYISNVKTCLSCHKKDDVHFFKGKYEKVDCNTCHGLKTWKTEIKFDHQKDTGYKLVEKHAEVSCKDCHIPKKTPRHAIYKWPDLKKKACLTCHENYHKANLSPQFSSGNCTQCHTQTAWKIPQFNHKVTRFILKGKHAEAKCVDCHKVAKPTVKNPNWTGLKTACLACHDDFHKFGLHKSKELGNLNQCSICHNDSNWKTIHNFEHNSDTRYDIDGEHSKLKCAECHLPKVKNAPLLKIGIYAWPHLTDKTCENCHKSPHIGKFSKEILKKRCTECHVTSGWQVIRKGENFKHDQTRFKLTGKHSKTTCTACHVKDKKQIFQFKGFEKGFCNECHQNVHINQMSPKMTDQACSQCHSTDNFKLQKAFDHNQTRYRLTGSHEKLKCEQCHIATQEKFPVRPPSVKHQYLFPKLAQEQCLSCHADVHKGQLPQNCLQCHTTGDWHKVRFEHNKDSQYLLKGKHSALKCSECHRPIAGQFTLENKKQVPTVHYKPIGMQCLNCHNDAHKGHYGKQCLSCHTETEWKITRDFHKNFNLSGVHFTLQCQECHKQGGKLAGLSNECNYCHRKDDVHGGSLPRCDQCHRQQFWEEPKFNHSLSRFPLRGVHRTITCQECHANGVYRGLSTACIACHATDLAGAISPVNHTPSANFTDCASCHKQQFAW